MGTVVPEYYCGILEVGADADWDRVAKSIDLLRASGVPLEPGRALVKEGRAFVPFYTLEKENPLEQLVGGAKDNKGCIEALSPYRLADYRKLDLKKASAHAFDTLAKLTRGDGPRGVKPADIKPAPAGEGGASDPFEGLVGLSRQRKTLEKVANLVAKHGRGAVESLHMVFSGAPGTGKSELAMRLCAHLDALGVTDGRGTFVKASAADLVAPYLGQTSARTRSVVESAYGGVLFLDEAYALLEECDYGREAIDTLVEMLESERGRLVCVAAGYPDELERLFKANSGLRDRFAFRLEFPDYSVDELEQIFLAFASKKGFEVDPGARPELRRELAALKGKADFANARTVRRLFDRSIMELAMRSDGLTVASRDLKLAFAQEDLGGAPSQGRVGF